MKLRNKVTGEIAEVEGGVFKLKMGVLEQHLQSLEKLVDEWEDYEEPKDFWFIDDEGDVEVEGEEYEENLGKMKSIGNYFSTKEEAELAVRKLKAWKRLKDKGFDFEYVEGHKNLCGNGFEIPITATMPPEAYTDVEVSKDLDLLFGGKE